MPLRRMLAALAVLAAAVSGCAPGGGGPVAGVGGVSTACPAVFFGVPGSGEGVHNTPAATLPDGVSAADAARFGRTIARVKDEVQHVAGPAPVRAVAVDYPAIPVDRYLSVFGLSDSLDRSERKGVDALVALVRAAFRGGCANRPVLLAGYSQGAEVVSRAVGRLSARERSGVTIALLGNPSYRPGLPGDFPGTSSGSGLRPTFRDGQTFRLPDPVRSRTIDVCAPGDPVCGVDPHRLTVIGKLLWVLDHEDVHGHAYAFGSENYPRAAAAFLWRHRYGR